MKSIYSLLLLLTVLSCQSQIRKVGGPCEGCEALYEYGSQKLTPLDTLPYWNQHKPSLQVQGTVYQRDGKTPASDVVIYIYHTNGQGVYETRGEETDWAKRHGIHRGWTKTDATGKYMFLTFRPAAYPDHSEPQHIHFTVKEPNTIPYYLDDLLFDDDPLLTEHFRKKQNHRGGNGIVTPFLKNGVLKVKRDIILGLNIPDYD